MILNLKRKKLILHKNCVGHNWYDFLSILSLHILDRHRIILQIEWDHVLLILFYFDSKQHFSGNVFFHKKLRARATAEH